METPEQEGPKRTLSKALLIVIRIWNYSWVALLGGPLLAGLVRPHQPDPGHGFTEELKALGLGIVFVSPLEKFAFNALVASIFVVGGFVVMPTIFALWLERRKQRAG